MSESRAGYSVDVPYGLDQALLRILGFHVGREKAISRGELVKALEMHGFKVGERVARAGVNELRKTGQPICSAGGEDGGYWMAKDWQELNEYHERELHSRAMDLLEQEKAQKRTAEQLWGRYSPGVQYCLDI
jgi:hypothetical protein